MKKLFAFSCILVVVLSFFFLNFDALREKEMFDFDASDCVNVNSADALINKYGYVILEWEFGETSASDPYKVSLYLSGSAESRTFVCNMSDGSVYALKDKTLYALIPQTVKNEKGEETTTYTTETTVLTQTQYSELIEVNSLENPLITFKESGITSSPVINNDCNNLITDYPVPSGLINITLSGTTPEIGKDFSGTLVPDVGYYLPDKLSVVCNYLDSSGKMQQRSITSADEITFKTLLRSWLFKEKYFSETGCTYDSQTGAIAIEGEQINGEIEVLAAANPFFKFMSRYYGFSDGHIRKSYIIDEETGEIQTFTIKYFELSDKGSEKNKCKIGNAYVINDTYFNFSDKFKENFPELYEELNGEMRLTIKEENTFDYSK